MRLLVGMSQVLLVLYQQDAASRWADLVLEALAVLARIFYIFLIYRAQGDERCFMFKAITKPLGG